MIIPIRITGLFRLTYTTSTKPLPQKREFYRGKIIESPFEKLLQVKFMDFTGPREQKKRSNFFRERVARAKNKLIFIVIQYKFYYEHFLKLTEETIVFFEI